MLKIIICILNDRKQLSITFSCFFRKISTYQQMSDNQWFFPASQFIFMAQDVQGSKSYLHYPSNLTADAKLIKLHARDYNRIKELSKWRFETEYSVFKILRAKVQQEKRESVLLQIFIQRPQYLLNELNSITLLQALFIIKSCLPTLQRLVQKFGYFQLNEKMIGISRTNDCKLWINQNLQKFQPQKQALGEQAMTYTLLKLVQKITNKNEKVKQFFQSGLLECTTFMKAQKFLSIYAYQENLVIPPQFYARNRKCSAEIAPILTQIADYNCSSCTRSFILQKRQRQISPHYIPNSQKKQFFIKQQPKPSFITFNKNIPIKISSKQSLKTTCQMKQSKQTLRHQNESVFKSYCFQRKSLPEQYRSPFQTLGTKKSMLHSFIHNAQLPIFRQIEERNRKKLTIMSTLDVKIASQLSKKQPSFHSQKKTKESPVQMKNFCKQKLQNNQWKKTISQLFSSQKNLKESMSYGEEEKVYLKQVQLHQLGQFGRFINTSLLEIDQSQQDISNRFKKICH